MEIDYLQNEILIAMAKIDVKGTDEKVSHAMSIVYEAFSLYMTNSPFSANDLYSSTHGVQE